MTGRELVFAMDLRFSVFAIVVFTAFFPLFHSRSFWYRQAGWSVMTSALAGLITCLIMKLLVEFIVLLIILLTISLQSLCKTMTHTHRALVHY